MAEIMGRPLTRFEKITLAFSVIQTIATLAIPIVVWKMLDPALEELHYKSAPILNEVVSTAGDNISREYYYLIQNVGKFPMDHVSLLFIWQNSGVALPKQMCSEDATLVPCIGVSPHIPIEVKLGEVGQFSQINLLNPIPGESRVEVSLHGMAVR
jgi:hypothetical protein